MPTANVQLLVVRASNGGTSQVRIEGTTFSDNSPAPGSKNERIQILEAAIRKHRDVRGHQLCWLQDRELWATLGEPIPEDRDIPPWPEFMTECAKYRASLDGPR